MDAKENQETQFVQPPQEKDGLSSGAKAGIVVGILIGAVLLVLVLIFLVKNPGTTETIRDLVIIVLALESLVVGTLLVVLVYQLITLIRMLRDDIKPMIQSTQETVDTVKGTATFVSERITKPAIEASGYITGIGRSIGVLLKMLPRRRSETSSGEEAVE